MHELIGKVDRIVYYPIKSCGRLEAEKVKLTPEGIEGDRQYMVVNALPDGQGVHRFVTQRDKTKKPQDLAAMALVKPEIVGNSLFITWGGRDPIEVSSDVNLGRELRVKVWDDVVNAVDQGDRLAEWFSDHLKTGVRLVKAAGSFSRGARQTYRTSENKIRMHDSDPVHWFFQESVDELSQVAGEVVPWHVFRPNVVVSGSPAQTEHLVFRGEIGGVPFTDRVPSVRCPITNVNQDTGEVKVGRALKHLAKYKRWRDRKGNLVVIFGEKALPQGEGDIRAGDEVVLIERRNPPLVIETLK